MVTITTARVNATQNNAQGKAIEQSWVSDTGKAVLEAVLVQSSKDKHLEFHLWCQREGDPNSALPKQVRLWLQSEESIFFLVVQI